MKTPTRLAAILAFPFLVLVLSPSVSAQGGEDIDVQTSGPVHEGFASPTVFEDSDPYYVDVDPPAVIEEAPPLEKPQTSCEWVPGYWSYNDDARNWYWVSGIWRVPPPQHVWISGYWIRTAWHRWRYVPGYWASVGYATGGIEYLPSPPPTLEYGPIGYAPWPSAIWIPGNWVWVGGGYLGWMWRPGYWIEYTPDWVWVPASYVWTPYGYVYCEGHYDQTCERRGLLFAPVCYRREVYLQPGYVYTPTFVINITIFGSGCLFTRPSYCHYYFGDYYAESCWQKQGIYPAYSFHQSKYGHDGLYAHAKWKYGKGDPKWGESQKEHFVYLRQHEKERPPRTLEEQTRRPKGSVRLPPGVQEPKGGLVAVSVRDVDDHATQLKVARLPDSEKGKLIAQAKDMRTARAERVKAEGQGQGSDKAPEAPRTVKSAGFVPGAVAANAVAGDQSMKTPKKPDLPKDLVRNPGADSKRPKLESPTIDGPKAGRTPPVVKEPSTKDPGRNVNDKPGDASGKDVPGKRGDNTGKEVPGKRGDDDSGKKNDPPFRKPDPTPPEKKPDFTPPQKKPTDPTGGDKEKKPDFTPPQRKPVDPTGGDKEKKPDFTPPQKKPVDPTGGDKEKKPDFTPPQKKPVDPAPPEKKPDFTPPQKKPVDPTPPQKKPVDPTGGDKEKKPDFTPPQKKPVDPNPQPKTGGNPQPPQKGDPRVPPPPKGDPKRKPGEPESQPVPPPKKPRGGGG